MQSEVMIIGADWPKGKGPIIAICSLCSGEMKVNWLQSVCVQVGVAYRCACSHGILYYIKCR